MPLEPFARVVSMPRETERSMNRGPPRSGWKTAGYLLAIVVLTSASSVAFADSGPVEGCVKDSENAGFWTRLSQSYEKHLFSGNETAASDPVPSAPNPNAPFDAEAAGYRQDLPPPPVSNPPWPYTTWNVGGTSTVGYENKYSSALMDAIYCGPNGKAWQDSR